MAQKKNYSRYFIILQEDEKGYALASDKLPTGYVKLELKNDKCKVSYYVQNLKKEDAPYYMVLILGKKGTNKLIRIGELNIDDYGRADVSYEYNSDDIANTQLPIDNISGAVVAKILDKNIIPVLSGFLTTDNLKWREFELLESSANKDKIKAEEKKEKEAKEVKKTKEEINVFDKYEEQIEDIKAKDVKEENNKAKLQETEVETFKKSEVQEEDIKVVDLEKDTKVDDLEDDVKEIKTQNNQEYKPRKDYSQEVNKKVYETVEDENSESDNRENEIFIADTHNNHIDYPTGETGTFFRGIAKDFKDVSNTIVDIKRCKWYRVPVNSIMDMYYIGDYNKYTTFYYPMINYYKYIEAYNHFIVGYKFDNEGKMKYLIYGIPGTKKLKHQPFRGKTGFVTWVPSKSKEDNVNGYWLMFYDFKNSTILIPSKK